MAEAGNAHYSSTFSSLDRNSVGSQCFVMLSLKQFRSLEFKKVKRTPSEFIRKEPLPCSSKTACGLNNLILQSGTNRAFVLKL